MLWWLVLACSDADIRHHQRVTGELTWTLDFDSAAESAGYVDCTYARSYDGTQVLREAYLCAECELVAEGEATLVDGADCYAQISSTDGTRTEWWGMDVDGAFFRSSLAQYPLQELSPLVAQEGDDLAVGWSDELELSAGSAELSGAGWVRYDFDPLVELDEPFETSASYTCGWPRNDPGDLELDYAISYQSVLPNVVLTDQCQDQVALWDFYGSWLIVDSSQPDCGPCQDMSAGAEDFVTELRAEGIDITVLSLLGKGLDEPWGTPRRATQNAWVDTFSLQDPVLADEGYGYALFPDAIESITGESFGYPAWLIVDPQMRVVHGNVGLADWDDVAEFIRAQ